MITLSQFVRTCYAPTFLYGIRSLNTIREYIATVELYIHFVGDLPLNEIDTPKNSRFLQGLQSKNLAVETIRKHCRNLNAVWSKAGPAGPRNRDALGFVKEAPWIRPPQAYKRLPRDIPDSFADSLYTAIDFCDACYKYPGYLDMNIRSLWWKALISLVTTTAIRRNVVFNLEWADFDFGHKYFVIPAKHDRRQDQYS